MLLRRRAERKQFRPWTVRIGEDSMERRARAKTKEKSPAMGDEVWFMEGRGSPALGKERSRNASSNRAACSAFNSLGMTGGEGLAGCKSDGGTEDEEEAAEAAFCEDGVRKKIGVLARMVGMEGCGQPGVVLTEVVRVLKELDGRARGVCSSRKS